MGKHAILKIKENKKKLIALINNSKNASSKNRLQALLLIKTKKFNKRSEVALSIGISVRTLERWLNEYKELGISSMLSSNRGGSEQSCMSTEEHNLLVEKLKDADEPLRSYKGATKWFNKKRKYYIRYVTLRNYMIRNFDTELVSSNDSTSKRKLVARKGI